MPAFPAGHFPAGKFFPREQEIRNYIPGFWEGNGNGIFQREFRNLRLLFPGIAGNGNFRSPLFQCNALLPCCCQSGDLAAGGLRLGCPQNTRGRETRNGGRYLLRFDFFSPEAFEWPWCPLWPLLTWWPWWLWSKWFLKWSPGGLSLSEKVEYAKAVFVLLASESICVIMI